MLFSWDSSYLEPQEALEVINSRPGVIPVDIDIEQENLIWFDVADYHFSESFFFVSVKKLLDQYSFSFASDLSILDVDNIISDAIYPTGFIFHMGRCGSTLIAKALARSTDNLVISEAPPHFLIWSIWNKDWQKPFQYTEKYIRRYRKLIFSLGRKRRSNYSSHFIKFTSFNILYLDFIRQAFPDVPILFLYRDPVEVMVAFADQGPGWQRFKDSAFGAFVAGCSIEKVKTMNTHSFHEHFLYQFMAAALKSSPKGLSFVNYNQLVPHNFDLILQALNFTASEEIVVQMKDQFKYYAKDDEQQLLFNSDSVAKQQKNTPEIEALVQRRLRQSYEQLQQAENNLFKQIV